MITDRAGALLQYNQNSNWQDSLDSARLALEAVRWLLVNQDASLSTGGKSITTNIGMLTQEKANLEKFLGATQPRAFGRTRFVRIGRAQPEGVAV